MIQPPPVNVLLDNPDTNGWKAEEITRWQRDKPLWRDLNPGNPGFYPLTVKTGYVIGVIHDICESVSCLLKDKEFARRTSYIPAYGIFVSAIDILGRCVEGNSCVRRSSSRTGFQWLAGDSSYATIDLTSYRLITTKQRGYTIEELVQLRNFSAHGQATSQFSDIDYEVLNELQPLITNGLEHYWSKLQGVGEVRAVSEKLCSHLAKANVLPLRNWPVFKCWSLFDRNNFGPYPSVTEIFSKFNGEWKI